MGPYVATTPSRNIFTLDDSLLTSAGNSYIA